MSSLLAVVLYVAYVVVLAVGWILGHKQALKGIKQWMDREKRSKAYVVAATLNVLYSEEPEALDTLLGVRVSLRSKDLTAKAPFVANQKDKNVIGLMSVLNAALDAGGCEQTKANYVNGKLTGFSRHEQ